jgi:hypothetical protein
MIFGVAGLLYVLAHLRVLGCRLEGLY